MTRKVPALPILGWLPRYRRSDFGADAVAGLTTAVMLIPQGMGYAMLAGLPPIHGLYAALAPIVLYAVLGTSRQLAVGPVAMDSILVAAGVGAIATVGTEHYILVAGATGLLVGLIQASLGFLRAGFLVNFLSRPVVSGFTSAAALIIAASQLHYLLGIELPRTHLVHTIVMQAVAQFSSWSGPTIAVAGLSLLLLLTVAKKWPRLPTALLVVVLTTLIVSLFGLAERGVAIVGEVPSGLPPLRVPTVSWDLARQLLPVAATIALVSFMETISVGRTFAQKLRYDVFPNRELIAIGFANLAGAMTGGYPIAGGFSRSAVNARAGARTQMAGLVTASVVAITLLAFTKAFYFLPKAALSAVIVAAVIGLIDLRGALEIYRVKRTDFALLALTFVATLSLGIQWGILVGVGASVLLFLIQTTQPHFAVLGRIPGSTTFLNIKRHPHSERSPGIIIVRIDAQLYFGNVTFLKDTLRTLIAEAEEPVHALVLEAAGVNQLDTAAAFTLQELDEELASQGVRLVLTRVKGPVREVLHRTGLLETLFEQGRLYLSTDLAVRVLQSEAPPVQPPDSERDPRAPEDRVGCGSYDWSAWEAD